MRWGKRKEKLGFTGYHWCPDFDVTKDSEWDLLRRKIIMPFALGLYGAVLVIRKGFRLLRQFESAE